MKIITRENAKKVMSLVLSLIMMFSICMPAFAAEEAEKILGSAEAITSGLSVEGTDEITVTNKEAINLTFSKADPSIGRNQDGWWAGIKLVAPSALTEDELKTVKYRSLGKDGWSADKSFWSAKDSAEGDAVHYIGAWMVATPESIANDDDGYLTLKYQFDWDNDGFNDEDQIITFTLDVSKINLDMSRFTGSAEAITSGLVADGERNVTITNAEAINLTFSKADPSIGRNQDGWWAGIKLVAPSALTEDELKTVKYRSYGKDGWSADKSFWSAKDSAEGDAVHYIGAWMKVTPETIANDADGFLTYNYQFDWDNDGFNDEDQIITFTLDTSKINLDMSRFTGSAEAITSGLVADGERNVTITNAETINLTFSKADPSIGRNQDGWWAGIKLVAPSALTEDELKTVKYRSYGKDGWSADKSFWGAKDSKEGDAVHYIGAWMIVTPESIANDDDGFLTMKYQFDWDNDGFNDEDQIITFTLDVSKINLDMSRFTGSAEAITSGLVADGERNVTITNAETINLTFSKADPSIGRNQDGWWAGIKLVAPSVLSEDELKTVKYRSYGKDGWSADKSFWSAKDSKEGDAVHYIGAWMIVTPESIANDDDGFLTMKYQFDWDNDGFNDEDQIITFTLDVSKINLDMSRFTGSAEAITSGLVADGERNVTITNAETINLTFSKADPSIGRNQDGWWAGIKLVAPSALTEDELKTVKYRSYGKDGWSADKSFWSAKDSKEGDAVHYIGAWMVATPESIANDDDGFLTMKYQFDWDNDGFNDEDQIITFTLDTSKINLDMSRFTGSAEAITDGFTVDGVDEITVINNEEITLDFAPADPSIGRNQDGWWAGIKVLAPSALSEDELKDVNFRLRGTGDWSADQSFWSSKESKEGDSVHYITAWVLVTPERIKKAVDGKLTYEFMFDWYKNGFDSEVQKVTFTIDTSKVNLIHSEGCTEVFEREYFAPDCENEGGYAISHCEVCGLTMQTGGVIPALGHSFTEKIIDDNHFYSIDNGVAVYYYNCANENCNKMSTEDTYTVNEEDYNTNFASVEGITEGMTVTGSGTESIGVVNEDLITLDFSLADPSIGRNDDAWWAGIKVLAPEGLTEAELKNAYYRLADGNSWTAKRSFWNAKDSVEGADRHFITLWLPVTLETIEREKTSGDGYLTLKYSFDWDGNGFNLSSQTITFRVDVTKVNLIHSAGCTKVIDIAAVPAGCFENGNTEQSHCEVCGLTLSEYRVIPAYDSHDFTEVIKDEDHLVAKADCVHYDLYYYSCSRCDVMSDEIYEDKEGSVLLDHVKTRKIDKIHLISAADCENAAKYYMGCENCDTVFKDEPTFTDGTPKYHLYTVEKVTTPASMNKKGYTNFYCEICGKMDKSSIAFAGIASVTLSKTTYDYTGKAITPSVTVKDTKGKTLKSGTDYKLTYSSNTAPGTATVKVTFIGKYTGSYTVNFKIVIPATSKITFTSTTSSVTLNWSKVTGATGYRIYQKTSSGWKLVAESSTNSVTIKKLSSAKRYTFCVKASVKPGKKTYWADKTKSVYTSTCTAATSKLAAAQTTTQIKLAWKAVKNAEGYAVLQKTSSGSWKTVTTTKSTSVTIKNLKSGTNYIYAVKAYTLTAEKVKVYSEAKEIITATKPVSTKMAVASSGGKLVVKWNKVSGATGYQILYKAEGAKSFKVLGTAEAGKNTFTKKGLTKGQKYIIAVRAYKAVQGGYIYASQVQKTITIK